MFGRHGMHGGRGFGPRGGPFGRGPIDGQWGAADHRGGGGRRRMFDTGELRLVLLKLIEEQPRHGYDLIRAIEERTGGAYAPSPGVIYPTLTLLGDMGLVEQQQGGGQRRLFAITEAGRAHLAERDQEVAALFARLDALADARARTDVAPIKRAIHNLRQVLHHKLGEEGLDRDRMHDAVALIDEVAGKIERL